MAERTSYMFYTRNRTSGWHHKRSAIADRANVGGRSLRRSKSFMHRQFGGAENAGRGK